MRNDQISSWRIVPVLVIRIYGPNNPVCDEHGRVANEMYKLKVTLEVGTRGPEAGNV